MGSTGRTYFVPYQPSVEKALRDLKREVRARGEFYGADSDSGEAVESEMDILMRAGSEGTHSPLDIIGVSETAMMCSASPLSPDEIIALFGTDRPTREQVEAKEAELNEPIARSEAKYLIIYRDDTPSEICFSGNTGD